MIRVSRKYKEVARWVRSVSGPSQWPAALALAIFRSRMPTGCGLISRTLRMMCPHVWIRPWALEGYAIRLNPTRAGNFVSYEELFFENIYDFERLKVAPDTVIDCGAYEGYFTVKACARFPSATFLAFEPNADNFAGLEANIHKNGLVVHASSDAVSCSNGTGSFVGDGCGGRLVAEREAQSQGKPVNVVDLREVIIGAKTRSLVLKLDVEGEELAMLPAVIPHLPTECALFFEWHHDKAKLLAVEQQLVEAGFVVQHVRTHMPIPGGTEFVDAFAFRAKGIAEASVRNVLNHAGGSPRVPSP